jgi:hypothetical protein
MPRFFFHVIDDIDARDDEGLELRDVEAARSEAIRGARALACEEVAGGRLNLAHRIEVTDARGELVTTVRFSAAIVVEDRV